MRETMLLIAAFLAAGCENSTEPPAAQPPVEAARIEAATPTALRGTVGTDVNPAPAVRALDKNGRPLAGVAISFRAEDGDAAQTNVTSDKDGLATVGKWTLSRVAGSQIVTARAAGTADIVLFRADAGPGPVAQVLPFSGNDQGGVARETLVQPLRVRLSDSFGNLIAGVPVTFTVIAGGGSIENAVAVTGSNGIASAGLWTLGSRAGVQQVKAESGAAQVIFSATVYESGSIIGVVRGSGTGYPWGNGNPGELLSGWPLSGIVATPDAAGLKQRFASGYYESGSFRFDNLATGRWTITFNGFMPWSAVFPGMRLYNDTAIVVTVEANHTTTLSDVAPRPVDPFIVVAIDHCPWGLSGPPTLNDWGDCDSGYWGAPVDVLVELNGIAGTVTSGKHYSFVIPTNKWSFELHDVVPGDYDVSVAPAAGAFIWKLVPWQNPNTRLHLDRGIAYALFSFWRSTS